jgi:hypothetical protein
MQDAYQLMSDSAKCTGQTQSYNTIHRANQIKNFTSSYARFDHSTLWLNNTSKLEIKIVNRLFRHGWRG